MKRIRYRFVGLMMAFIVIVSNIQIINVSAAEKNTTIENTGGEGKNTQEEEQLQEDYETGQILSDEENQVMDKEKTDSIALDGTDDPEMEKDGQNTEEAESSGQPELENSGISEQSASEEDTEESAVAIRQSWEDANSWRFQNGQLVSMQDNLRFSQYTTWPNISGAVARGIDVSKWQGKIDWQQVKNAGVDYAIIRCGFGSNYPSQDDEYWVRNVSECERLGIPYGVYLYSYAQSTAQAKSEAEHVLRLIAGHNLSYPVYFDLEDNSQMNLGTKALGDIAQTFCDVITSAGYEVGIYANTNWFTNYLTDSRFNQWDRWVAQYNTQCTYKGTYTMWQCSSQGIVSGISGYVDLNLDFGAGTTVDTSSAKIVYQAHVQNIGWQTAKVDGTTAGTTNRSLRVEALKISKGGMLQNISGDIKYRVHVQNIGTQSWVTSGQMAGTTNQNKRVEAIQIALTGNLAIKYDIYYRVHVQQLGWMKWVKGGESDSNWAGTNGLGLRIEAFEIQLVEKGEKAPTSSAIYSYITEEDVGTISYSGHQQDYGNLVAVSEGSILGVVGEAKRMEALEIALHDKLIDGTIQYRVHVQNTGWQSWKNAGQLAGTTGEAKRLEAVQIQLTSGLSTICDVWYRVHAQNYGWLGWAKNGQIAGTTGLSYRIEAIQIMIIPKGKDAPGLNSNYYKS